MPLPLVGRDRRARAAAERDRLFFTANQREFAVAAACDRRRRCLTWAHNFFKSQGYPCENFQALLQLGAVVILLRHL